MPRPRLVATDLDGTLLGARGELSERTARTWRRLDAAGIESVIVTARPPRWVDHLAGITGDHGIVLCGNGAFVYDVARRRVRETHGIEPDAFHALLADLRGIDGVTLAVELADGLHREPDYLSDGIGGVPEQVDSVIALDAVDRPVGKILARTDAMDMDAFHAQVTEVIGQRALLSVSSDCGLAEIGPAGVTKAAALEAWCAGLAIDADDVWAFGDMPNDIPMLAWAGTGWAVANAHPEVHAVADRACGANTEDGVAIALEEMLEGA